MKHKNFLWLLLLFVSLSVAAQLPERSTEQSPIWYYIQVQGDSDRAGRVFTAEENTKIAGREQINTTDAASVASQLWRFEGNGKNYTIINKLTGKNMNLSYDADREIGMGTLTEGFSPEFQFIKQGNFFQIKSETPASGGSADELFLHQANSGGSRDYCVMLVSSSWSDSENSRFAFVLFEDFSIDYSDESNESWYSIASGNETYRTQVLTETTEKDAPQPFVLKALEGGNPAQQWKIIKSTDGRIQIVNRATRHNIETRSIASERFNLTQAGENAQKGNGWSLTYLGNGQYTIGGVEEDLIERFLHASVATNQPETFDPKTSKGTFYSWLFKKTENPDSVDDVAKNQVKVTVEDGRIYVEGNPDFQIHTLKGNTIPNNTRLVPGVYFVTVDKQTTKVIVN